MLLLSIIYTKWDNHISDTCADVVKNAKCFYKAIKVEKFFCSNNTDEQIATALISQVLNGCYLQNIEHKSVKSLIHATVGKPLSIQLIPNKIALSNFCMNFWYIGLCHHPL